YCAKDHPRLNKFIRIERAKDLSQLKKFIKLVRRKQTPVYCSNVTHLEISYYHSLSDKKIISIIHSYPNITHLSFINSIAFSNRALELTGRIMKHQVMKYRLNIGQISNPDMAMISDPIFQRHIVKISEIPDMESIFLLILNRFFKDISLKYQRYPIW